ncbi:uncharacterized protein METZ01_LOCUS439497 [marine metagenome]|uniref:Uncharacterized protein n=1 Tax=marine metagenome TaxID=408172 RepID=A0A382YTU8_9ZZZZ
MVLADSRKISRVPRYSGVIFNKIFDFHIQGYHLLWLGFPSHSINHRFYNLSNRL